MSCKAFFTNRYNIYVSIIALLLMNLGFGQQADAADAFQIRGYYLGATPEELGVVVDSDFDEKESSYEVLGKGNVSLFFTRVGEDLRAYRIVKEEVVSKEDMESTLNELKVQYGVPEMQHIEASYIKESPKIMKYTLSATNRASWNITESQEFIAWIEQGRIIYELVENNPQEMKIVKKTGSRTEEEPGEGESGEGEAGEGGWESDF